MPRKTIRFHEISDEKKETVEKLVALARHHEPSNAAILIYVRSVAHAKDIAAKLGKTASGRLEILTALYEAANAIILSRQRSFRDSRKPMTVRLA